MRFEGKKAVVTGGGGGMGKCICIGLAKEGADVAVLDLNQDNAERVAKELRALERKGVALGVDVGDFRATADCIKEIYDEFGRIDFLVNAAGYGKFILFKDITEKIWDDSIATHLKGVFNLSRHVINGMIDRKYGRIVNISSVAGLVGSPTDCHYSAAKAGVIGFTKALAKEVASVGVTVNCVAPGVTDTPFLVEARAPSGRENYESVVKATPVGRLGKPEEIAAMCLYLLSDDAAFITGVTIPVAGGYFM